MALVAPYLPQPVDDIRLAFPAGVTEDLMPDVDDIPAEFRDGDNKWCALANRWFGRGLPATVEFHLRPGIDGETAYRHLSALLGSFEPKHQDKIAAVAFLMNAWFTDVTGLDE